MLNIFTLARWVRWLLCWLIRFLATVWCQCYVANRMWFHAYAPWKNTIIFTSLPFSMTSSIETTVLCRRVSCPRPVRTFATEIDWIIPAAKRRRNKKNASYTSNTITNFEFHKSMSRLHNVVHAMSQEVTNERFLCLTCRLAFVFALTVCPLTFATIASQTHFLTESISARRIICAVTHTHIPWKMHVKNNRKIDLLIYLCVSATIAPNGTMRVTSDTVM